MRFRTTAGPTFRVTVTPRRTSGARGVVTSCDSVEVGVEVGLAGGTTNTRK